MKIEGKLSNFRSCKSTEIKNFVFSFSSFYYTEVASLGKVYVVGRGISYLVVQLSEVTVKVDEKGRVVIPSNIRRQLNIKNIVKMSIKGEEVTLKPVEDPLSSLEKLVVKGTVDVEREIRRLRRVAELELQKEA